MKKKVASGAFQKKSDYSDGDGDLEAENEAAAAAAAAVAAVADQTKSDCCTQQYCDDVAVVVELDHCFSQTPLKAPQQTPYPHCYYLDDDGDDDHCAAQKEPFQNPSNKLKNDNHNQN